MKNLAVIDYRLAQRFEVFLDVSPLTVKSYKSTVKSYKSGVKRFLAFMAENGIKNPNRDSVIAFKNSMLEHGRKPTTVSSYLSALRRFFSWAESEALYPDITKGVKAPKISRAHKKDCFTGNQIKGILANFDTNTLEGARNYALFSLMTCTGLRTIEISRAKIEDIRSECGVPVLYVQGKGRTEKADFVKIPERIENALKNYLKLRGKVDATEALFSSLSDRNFGQSLTTTSISRICKMAMKEAGFNSSRLTAHSLRHTAVTLALMNGAELADVQAFARHSSINTTLSYSHAVNRLKSGIENSIERSIF